MIPMGRARPHRVSGIDGQQIGSAHPGVGFCWIVDESSSQHSSGFSFTVASPTRPPDALTRLIGAGMRLSGKKLVRNDLRVTAVREWEPTAETGTSFD